MNEIRVVYAKSTISLPTVNGANIHVRQGSHWPADDPLVREHPNEFSNDPRFGMCWSGQPPAYMALPPGEPLPGDEAPAQPRGRRS